jgi:hypothetical protein
LRYGIISRRSFVRPQQSRSSFSGVLLAQTIRLIEDQGPLEDSEAMRQAFRSHPGREARLIERARLLAQRVGLNEELARWRELALYVWLALAALVFIMAYGIAAALLGGGRSLNAVLAFFGVLGMHGFTLLLWLSGLLVSLLSGAGVSGRISLGNLFLRLIAWVPVDRGPHSLPLARAATALFRQSKLTPWISGLISHSVWAASFVLVLVALWFGFSFREYRLTWETTILHADFFIRFVQLTGWLPGLLGFPVPDTSTLLRPGAAGSDHRAWALWLIGCAVVYGLLIRIILAGICLLIWQKRKDALRIDTSDPYFRKLLVRFEQMEASEILDREQRSGTADNSVRVPRNSSTMSSPAVIGYELPDEYPWPPEGLSPSLSLIERIAGGSQERRQLLERLAQVQPRRLLVVCNLSATPDRGTERFLREAEGSAGLCALLPVALSNAHEAYLERWQSWLADSGMSEITMLNDAAQAGRWLEELND